MIEIPNKYVICTTPSDDDAVWEHVVERDHVRRSLDGSLVVLKWPVEESPHWAMVRRLGGTTYTHEEVLAVLARAGWTPPPIEDDPVSVPT